MIKVLKGKTCENMWRKAKGAKISQDIMPASYRNETIYLSGLADRFFYY